MATYDYDAIEKALSNVYNMLADELFILKSVQASSTFIEEYERDLKSISDAKDVVFRYQDLES